MIYVITFIAGIAVGYTIEFILDMLTDEYHDDSQH